MIASRFFDILMWTILAAIIVLVVMNASKVATLILSGGAVWLKETALLTGTGYAKAA
jgi:hypothetical protein